MHLSGAPLMNTRSISFHGELRKISILLVEECTYLQLSGLIQQMTNHDIFSIKLPLTFIKRQFAWMKCQSLFSGKQNKKLKCRLMKFLPSMLSINLEPWQQLYLDSVSNFLLQYMYLFHFSDFVIIKVSPSHCYIILQGVKDHRKI